MKNALKILLTSAIIMSIFALAGCGGGGGGNKPTPPPPTPPPSSASISVNADKQTLKIPQASIENEDDSTSIITVTGSNITKKITIKMTDRNDNTNPLNITTSSCDITASSTTCRLTVRAQSNNKKGKSDTLDIASTDNDPNISATVSFELETSPPTPPPTPPTPSITTNPHSIYINKKQPPSSFSITLSASNLKNNVKVTPTISNDANGAITVQTQSCKLTAGQTNNCALTFNISSTNISKITTATITFAALPPISITPVQITIGASPAKLKVRYCFDSTHVGGDSGSSACDTTNNKDEVVSIKTINSVINDPGHFSIDGNGDVNISNTTPAGLYQVNVRADKLNDETVIESSWNSFYVNVAPQGSGDYNALTINKKPITMIYSYTHEDPTKSGNNFDKVYSGYAQDLNYVNTTLKSPVNVLASEFGGPQYQNSIKDPLTNPGYWKISTSSGVTDIKQQVMQSQALGNAMGDMTKATWYSGTSGAIANLKSNTHNVTQLAPDLTLGNAVKATFTYYDPEQLKQLTQKLMAYAIDPTTKAAIVPGLSFDLESGTSNSDAVAFKSIADHLAHKGIFFGYYEFADKAFQPSIIDAMGPLGIAYISAYDVGTQRASESEYNTDAPSVNLGTALYTSNGIFATNQSCNSYDPNKGSTQAGRDSWCNLSSNDSKSANKAAWTASDKDKLSTEQAMKEFNGHYSIVLPIGESSTDFSYLELINPDFSILVAPQAGLVVTDPTATTSDNTNACAQLINQSPTKTNNFWDAKMDYSASQTSAIEDNPIIDKCLFQDQSLPNAKSTFKFNSYQLCGRYTTGTQTGQWIPYSKCILISSNLSATNDAEGIIGLGTPESLTSNIGHPTQADYMRESLKGYITGGNDTDLTSPNMVGFSLFALQDQDSGPSDAYLNTQSPNHSIQEPWYIGGYQLNSKSKYGVCDISNTAPTPPATACDPFYISDLSTSIIASTWAEFNKLQKKYGK